MKNSKLIIVGAGETAFIAYEYFMHDSDFKVVAFSVNRKFITHNRLHNLPIIALEDLENQYDPDNHLVFVAMSSGRLNRNRTTVYKQVKSKGYTCASYISSRSFVWNNVVIGENCFIFEDNVLQPFVRVGNNVTLWSGNHVGHNSVIKDNCFISSHCVISGFCEIGENSFLGVNCTIANNITIGHDNFIGAGVLIQKNTHEKEVYQNKQTELFRVNSHRLFRIRESH